MTGVSLLQLALAGLCPSSAAAYRGDLALVAAWRGEDVEQLLHDLVEAGPGPAAQLVSSYREHLDRAGLAPATARRRIAALRSCIGALHAAQVCSWTIPVERSRGSSGAVRQVAGPTPAQFAVLLRVAARPRAPIGRRDAAALRLSWDLGLRRSELCALQREDYTEAPIATLRVRRKGGRLVDRTVPRESVIALRLWMEYRDERPGPLLAACRSSGWLVWPLRQLHPGAWARHLQELGERAGLPALHPHALRHGATTALLRAGVPIPAVAEWLDHAGLSTVQSYFDRSQDRAGRVAALAAQLPEAADEGQLAGAAPAPLLLRQP